jgi:hypothetical protein
MFVYEDVEIECYGRACRSWNSRALTRDDAQTDQTSGVARASTWSSSHSHTRSSPTLSTLLTTIAFRGRVDFDRTYAIIDLSVSSCLYVRDIWNQDTIFQLQRRALEAHM